jgi:aspartate ammonia-lyase
MTISNQLSATRREHDLLGERDVPASALYGVQTLRALENFPISGVELQEFPTLVSAIAAVKEAAAEANRDLRLLSDPVAARYATESITPIFAST